MTAKGGSTRYAIVYNGGPNTVQIDEEGHLLQPGDWGAAQQSYIRDYVGDGGIFVKQADSITNESSEAAQKAKADYERLTEEWVAERDAAEAPKTDYDKSDSKSTQAKGAVKNTSANKEG